MRTATFLTTAILIVSLVCTASAERVWEPWNGPQVFQPANPEMGSIEAVDSEGNTLFIWSDGRDHERLFYGQLIAPDGDFLWPVGGVPVGGLDDHTTIEALATEDDNFIVCWHRNQYVFTQKCDRNGNLQWATQGEPSPHGILLFETTANTIRVTNDGAGGCILITGGNDNPYTAHHVLSDGTFDPDWPAEGKFLVTHGISYVNVLPDYENGNSSDLIGFVMFYRRNSLVDGSSVFAQKYDLDANPVWDADPIGILPDSTQYSNLYVVRDGVGGYFASAEHLGIVAQHIDVDGNLLYGTTGYRINTLSSSDNFQNMVASTELSAIVMWHNQYGQNYQMTRFSGDTECSLEWENVQPFVTRSGYSVSDGLGGVVSVYQQKLQHVTVDGELLYGSDGMVVTTINSAYPRYVGQNHVFLTSALVEGYSYFFNSKFQVYDTAQEQLLFPLQGIHITDGLVAAATSEAIFADSDFAYVVWADNRADVSLPFLQKLDLDTGESVFDSLGVPLLPAYLDDPQITMNWPLRFLERDGEMYLGFCESFGDRSIVLQKYNTEGEILWGEAGSQFVGDGEADQVWKPYILLAQNGDLLLIAEAWCSGPNDLLMQRFDPLFGQSIWTDGANNYRTILERDHHHIVAAEQFASGDIILVNFQSIHVPAYLLMVDENADLLANVELPDSLEFHSSCMMQDELLTLWSRDETVYGILLDQHGSLVWGDDPQVLIEMGNDDFQQLQCAAYPDSDSFWLSWYDWNEYEVMLQRFSHDGQPLLDQPVIVSDPDLSANMMADGLLPFAENGVAVSFIQYDAGGTRASRCYRELNSDGTFTAEYEDGASVLSDTPASNENDSALMISDGDGGVVMAWQDDRSSLGDWYSPGVYAQRLIPGYDDLPGESDEPEVPDQFVVAPAYPNPFNVTTKVSLELTHAAIMRVRLFNVLGQEVMTLADRRFTAGQHALTVDAAALSSGMYFLSVQQVDGASKLQKLVLLK